MMKIKVRNAPKVAEVVKDLPEIIKESLNNAMFTMGTDIQKAASENLARPYPKGPKSKRNLAGSVEMSSDRAARRYEIGSRLGHAKHVEFGTGPHTSATGMAEFERSLRDWHSYVGLPPESYGPIKAAIQHRGLPPRPFLRPAFMKERDNFPITFADELIRLLPPTIK